MNAEKLKKMSASVRTGGKGSVRRKKVVRALHDELIALKVSFCVYGKRLNNHRPRLAYFHADW